MNITKPGTIDHWAFHTTNVCPRCGCEWTITEDDPQRVDWMSVAGLTSITAGEWVARTVIGAGGDITQDGIIGSHCPTCGKWTQTPQP